MRDFCHKPFKELTKSDIIILKAKVIMMKLRRAIAVFLLFFIFSIVKVTGTTEVTTSYDGQGHYRVLETVVNDNLGHDITFRRDLSESRTLIDKTPNGGSKNAAGNGGGGILDPDKFYGQNINILEGKATDGVKVVSWGYTSNSKYELKNMINLAIDYEKNHPGWKVIGGMNADFFDMQGAEALPYQPLGPMISDGEVLRASGASNYSLMIGFKNKGLADDLIAKKYINSGNGFESFVTPLELSIYDKDDHIIKKFVINKQNTIPETNEISLYHAVWNSDKKIVAKDIEESANAFIIEKAEKALANNSIDFYGRGVITNTTHSTLGEGQFAIISNNNEVNSFLDIGVKVKVERSFEGIYQDVEELTCGHGFILENNEESKLLNEVYYYTRAPRSLLGIKDDGTIVMLTVDGRQPDDNMYGATQEEMAAIMKHYGCVSAYNLDGGGSTTLIVRDGNTFKTANVPSDSKTSLRTVANGIFFVVREPEIDESVIGITSNSVELDLKINDYNNHDIKDLYVKLNDSLQPVINNRVIFENLQPNTEYLYQIYYKDKDDQLSKTILGGKVMTAKRLPKLLDILIEEKDGITKIIPVFDDPDKSLVQQSFTINKKTSFVISGSADFKGLNIDFNTDPVFIYYNYRYNLNNLEGVVEVDLINPHQKSGLFLQLVLKEHHKILSDLLN